MEITLREIPANTQSNEYSDFIPIFIAPYLKENKQYLSSLDIRDEDVNLNVDEDYEYYKDSLECHVEYNKIIKTKTNITITNTTLPNNITLSEYIDLTNYTNTISLILFNSSDNIVHTTKVTPIIDSINEELTLNLNSIISLPNGTYSYILITKFVNTNFSINNNIVSFDFYNEVYDGKIFSNSYIIFKTRYKKPLIYNSYLNNKIDFIEPYSSIFSLSKYFIFINDTKSIQDIVDNLLMSDYGYYVVSFDTSQDIVNSIISSVISESSNYKTIITSTNLVESKIVASVTYTK